MTGPRHKVCWFEKPCGKCGRTQPLSEYNLQRGRWDSHATICKTCNRVKNMKRYAIKGAEIVRKCIERRNADRLAALRHYSGGEPRCVCCNESQLKFLTFDHIDGGGGKHWDATDNRYWNRR